LLQSNVVALRFRNDHSDQRNYMTGKEVVVTTHKLFEIVIVKI